MTPEEKKAQEEKEAADKAASAADKDKAAHDKAAEKAAADDAAALGKLTAEQDRLAKEQVKLHEKFAAEKAKRPVKDEELVQPLITAPENEWKDYERKLKEREEK